MTMQKNAQTSLMLCGTWCYRLMQKRPDSMLLPGIAAATRTVCIMSLQSTHTCNAPSATFCCQFSSIEPNAWPVRHACHVAACLTPHNHGPADAAAPGHQGGLVRVAEGRIQYFMGPWPVSRRFCLQPMRMASSSVVVADMMEPAAAARAYECAWPCDVQHARM